MMLNSKKNIRKTYQNLRSALNEKDVLEAQHSISKNLFSFYKTLDSTGIIAGYYPIKNEVDITNDLANICKLGTVIALPLIKDKKLTFRIWDQDISLVKSKYGVSEPNANSKEVSPDILFIPLLACDKSGTRIGYGGGYYDRTLRKLRKHKKIIAVGVCFDSQLAEPLPFEKHDEKMDYIITEKEILAIAP